MTPLRVHRYQFNSRLQQPLPLNFYSGSMLRGAFGHALKKITCLTKMDDCKRCLLYRQCQYPRIFAPPPPQQNGLQTFSEIPPPFIIEPPAPGRQTLETGAKFCFQQVLIGSAIDQLPLIILAWQQALKQGLSRYQTRMTLSQVIFEPNQPGEQTIYQADQPANPIPTPVFKAEFPATLNQIRLSLLTPLRIQQKGRILGNELRGSDFIRALIRRYYLLQELYQPDYQPPDFTQLADLADKIQAQPDLKPCEWSRYSNRQKQKMTFRGVMGQIKLDGDLTPFIPLLVGGQWWHVGNKTSFGMGRYRIETMI